MRVAASPRTWTCVAMRANRGTLGRTHQTAASGYKQRRITVAIEGVAARSCGRASSRTATMLTMSACAALQPTVERIARGLSEE